jgi:hypothetical protein
MSISLTLAELKGMESSLTKLLDQQLAVKISYRLSKVLRLISKELTDIEDHRRRLIREHGTELADGNVTITDPEKLKLFQDEFNELLRETITLDFDPIAIDDLGDSLTLTVADVTVLSVLFCE